MILKTLILLILALGQQAWAMDESFFHRLNQKKSKKEEANHLSHIKKSYFLDLDGDQVSDHIEHIKSINGDILKSKLGSFRFPAQGENFKIEKLRLVSLNQNIRVLIVFFTDAVSKKLKYQKETRMYFLTFKLPMKKGSGAKMYRAEHIFYEREPEFERYDRRKYKVNLVDINEDGTNEIVTYYNGISNIYWYKKNNWIRQ